MGMTQEEPTRLQGLLDRYLADEPGAFDELIEHAALRLRSLARKMLARYPHVRRWEETDDVMQAALIRLHRSLKEVHPESKRAFFGLAATQMRRTLIDLARHYYGALGHGGNYESVVQDGDSERANSLEAAAYQGNSKPEDLERWTEFHETVEQLPEDDKEVISLIWYGGLMQKEVAQVLGISERTVIRRMNHARLTLNDLMGGRTPNTE
jgi:RNA polymerase sigma factor (sigma-70 family)